MNSPSMRQTAFSAPNWAISQRFGRKGGVGLHATLLTFATYCDADFACHPSVKRVADETEQDEKTVRRHVAIFRELGLVKSVRRYVTDPNSGRPRRTSDKQFMQLGVVVTPEQTEIARRAVMEREKAGKQPDGQVTQAVVESPASEDIMSSDESVADSASEDIDGGSRQRTSEPPSEDMTSTGVRGHLMPAQELLEELLSPELLENPGEAAGAATPQEASRLRDVVHDEAVTRARAIVTWYMDTWKITRNVTVIPESSRAFNTLVGAGRTAKSAQYVTAALLSGITPEQIAAALAAHGRQGHGVVPSKARWTELLVTAQGGQTNAGVRQQGSPTDDRVQGWLDLGQARSPQHPGMPELEGGVG